MNLAPLVSLLADLAARAAVEGQSVDAWQSPNEHCTPCALPSTPDSAPTSNPPRQSRIKLVSAANVPALGLTIVAVHSDCAVSGATPVDRRPGASACVADALAGRFDVLLVESLDRLSRNLVEQETAIRRLEHRGVRIIGVSDGYDTNSGAGRKLLRGVRGLISETYLDDLRAKTHRGLTGQIERGYHAGGLSYGYRSVVAGVNARGEPIGHRLEIDATQAEIVREIFTRYGAGESCQRIAADLNARGVRGPRGGNLVRLGVIRFTGEGCRRAK